MLTAFSKGALILVPLLFLVLGLACGDGDGRGPAGPGIDASSLNLPEDFPLYPGLKFGNRFILAQNLVIEASSDDAVDDIVAFYTEQLQSGRWQLVTTEETESQLTLFFSAEGFPSDGRLAVAEDTQEPGKTVVGIAIPVDVLENAGAE